MAKVEVTPTKAGRSTMGPRNRHVPADEAKVLITLGLATYATKEVKEEPKPEAPRQYYATRDMVAGPTRAERRRARALAAQANPAAPDTTE